MSEQQIIDADEAIARLDVIPEYDAGNGPGPCVHTFADAAFGLLGAHWYLDDLTEFMRRNVVQASGPMAVGMGHALVVLSDERPGPLFLATREPAEVAA
jgi:hypothetical protein